jgi:hypothetical protein
MEPWEVWIRSTELHLFVIRHWWVWPLCETIHYLGLSMLLGTVGLFDLRVLGVAKSIPPATLHGLIPFGIGGYITNLLTGIVFFFGFPDQYAYNSAFHFKLAFMALAGLNVAVFYSTAFRDVRALKAGADAPLRSKIITGISFAAWLSVLTCGRLLTFFRPPFFHHDV